MGFIVIQLASESVGAVVVYDTPEFVVVVVSYRSSVASRRAVEFTCSEFGKRMNGQVVEAMVANVI